MKPLEVQLSAWVPFPVMYFVVHGTDSPVTTGKKSRAGAGAPAFNHKACMQQSLHKCILFDEWSLILLRKKQRGGGLLRDLPGSPVVETRRSTAGDCRFDHVGNWADTSCRHDQNRKGGADTNLEPKGVLMPSPLFLHTQPAHRLQLWHVHTTLPSAGKGNRWE